MSKRNHFRDAVWSLLKSRPGEWIDGKEIATVGGAYAWRTRISDVRKFYDVTIQNRIIRIPGTQGYRMSQYRYLPTGPVWNDHGVLIWSMLDLEFETQQQKATV